MLENWVNVPTNSILTIHNQTVMVHPIKDQYYDRNPQHRRSTAFVRTKGLTANEKGASRAGTPFNLSSGIAAPPSLPHLADHAESSKQRFRGPTIPTIPTSTLPRTHTPLSHSETITSDPSSSSSIQSPTNNTSTGGTATNSLNTTDVRALTSPPLVRNTSQQQGNIKKKRASLSVAEAVNGGIGVGGGGLMQYFDTSPVTPEPVRTEFGNPDKIARMFPELALQ